MDYINHYKTSLDSAYFIVLTSELYFPDDTDHAGYMARDLLQIMESNGWVEDCAAVHGGILDMCTAVLSRYLLDMNHASIGDKSYSQFMYTTAQKLPKDVVCRLFAIAMSAKKEKSTWTFKVKCKLMSSEYGRPEGSIVKISIKSTDTVNYIRYLLQRELGTVANVFMYCKGHELANLDKLIVNTSISSNTALEIYSDRRR